MAFYCVGYGLRGDGSGGGEMKIERIATSRGNGELKMEGSVWISGPQPVHALPPEIVKLFEDKPLLDKVAICYKDEDGKEHFVVYFRIQEG